MRTPTNNIHKLKNAMVSHRKLKLDLNAEFCSISPLSEIEVGVRYLSNSDLKHMYPSLRDRAMWPDGIRDRAARIEVTLASFTYGNYY